VLVLIVLAVGIFELTLGQAISRADEHVASAETSARRLRAALETEKSLKSQHSALTQQGATTRAILANRLAAEARQQLLPSLLSAVTDSLPEDLALDSLREEEDGTLLVEGFGLTELAVKQFLRDLSTALASHGFAPREPVVRRRRGRLEVQGYAFLFRFETESSNP